MGRIVNAILVGTIHPEEKHPISRVLMRFYEPVVTWSLRWKWLVIGGAVATMAATWPVFRKLGTEFMPKLDEGMAGLRIVSRYSALDVFRGFIFVAEGESDAEWALRGHDPQPGPCHAPLCLPGRPGRGHVPTFPVRPQARAERVGRRAHGYSG